MKTQTTGPLVPAGGLVAIAGGALRAIASFAPLFIRSDVDRESFFVAADVCLTVGLGGFHARHSKSTGRPRAAGLALALLGVVAIRGNRAISTLDLYPAGAAIACGTILPSVRAWIAQRIPSWLPAPFLVSLLAGLGVWICDISDLSPTLRTGGSDDQHAGSPSASTPTRSTYQRSDDERSGSS